MTKKRIFVLVTIAMFALVFVYSFSTADPAQSPIHFDHGFHVSEAGLACTDCHTNIEGQGAGQWSIPDHSICESCHDVESLDNCGTCHVNPDEPTAVPKITGMYEGFAHKVHISAKVDCDQCHGKIQKEGDEPVIPEMNNCQQCHLNQRASLECGICHQGEKPRPADHKLATWKHDHGIEATLTSSDCQSCHTQESCDECHQGDILTGDPHPPTWLNNHFVDASYGDECLVCHETKEYCTSCHRASIPTPHEFGPQWANSQNGGAHRDEAAAFGETCIVCHDLGGNDPTCARCHD